MGVFRILTINMFSCIKFQDSAEYDNVYIKTDPAGNIKIDKEKSTERVDGAVALVMALDRAMRNCDEDSVYNERGLIIL